MKSFLLVAQALLLSQTSAIKLVSQSETAAETLQTYGLDFVDIKCQYTDVTAVRSAADTAISNLNKAFASKKRLRDNQWSYQNVFGRENILTIQGLSVVLHPCEINDSVEHQEALARVQEFHALLDTIYPETLPPYAATGNGADGYNNFFVNHAAKFDTLKALRAFVAGGVESQTLDGLFAICGEDISTCSSAMKDLGGRAFEVMNLVKALEFTASSQSSGTTGKSVSVTASTQNFVELWYPYMQFLLVSYRDMLYAFTYKAMQNNEIALTTEV